VALAIAQHHDRQRSGGHGVQRARVQRPAFLARSGQVRINFVAGGDLEIVEVEPRMPYTAVGVRVKATYDSVFGLMFTCRARVPRAWRA
jgi:hypothetical protein